MRTLMMEEDFLEMIYNLENAVDRYYLAGIFYGITNQRKTVETIANIKKEDVDLNKNMIYICDGKSVSINNNFKKIIIEAMAQKAYIKMSNSFDIRTNEDYSFNEDSPYILRAKPTSRNNFGVKPLVIASLNAKYKKIMEMLGEDYSVADIKLFGVYNVLINTKKKLGVVEADAFLKEKNLTINLNTLASIVEEINNQL